jgi:hypothetical protein
MGAYAGKKRDEGCVFVEAAPPKGNGEYDWENGKIVLALNATDVGKLIFYLKAPTHKIWVDKEGKPAGLNIFHDKGAGTSDRGKSVKTLKVNKPADRDSYFFELNHNDDGEVKTAKIPVSPDEALVLGILLEAALPRMLYW